MSKSSEGTWNQLLREFVAGVEKSIEKLQERDIENIPGARQALLNRLNNMKTYFPKDDGKIFVQAIDSTIQNAFFPVTKDFTEAFSRILNSRTHEQDFIINELLNGFVTSKAKAIASYSQGPIIDRMVEAFSRRSDFNIVDHQFYAMFGDPNKPRNYVKSQLKELVNLFGLVSYQYAYKDVRTSEQKTVTFYTFPTGILAILNEKYIVIDEELGHAYVSEAFDRNVFICMFLANIAVNRDDLEKIGGSYTINGISAIFALILLLSFMPKVSIEETNPILKDPSFNEQNMSVIPKSWMMKQVLESLFDPLIKIIAYRVGGGLWFSKIMMGEKESQILTQIRFMLRDVSPWILGNLCRVEIPIFVEIANIFTEVFVGYQED